jgi:type I restriction enzyme, R subunit
LARTYGADDASKPDPVAQFNPALLPRPADQAVAKSIAQIGKLNDDLKAKDAALDAAVAAKSTLEAELAAARAELAAIKAANQAQPDTHDYDEASTRTEFIDADLLESGWSLVDKRDREYPVQGMPDGKTGYVDYVLWGADGKPLGLIEAKRSSKDAHAGQNRPSSTPTAWSRRSASVQSSTTATGSTISSGTIPSTRHGRSTGFTPATNSNSSSSVGQPANLLPTARFRETLSTGPTKIARSAVFWTASRLRTKREALLVMATGAGKTRTVIALADILGRANWVKRTLFLADRVALVKQAVDAFKNLLPESAPVNLLTDKNTDSRV